MQKRRLAESIPHGWPRELAISPTGTTPKIRVHEKFDTFAEVDASVKVRRPTSVTNTKPESLYSISQIHTAPQAAWKRLFAPWRVMPNTSPIACHDKPTSRATITASSSSRSAARRRICATAILARSGSSTVAKGAGPSPLLAFSISSSISSVVFMFTSSSRTSRARASTRRYFRR